MTMVSVIIPTYNRASLIREALESVFAQSYTDYEVIVVDDGSTDSTHEVLRPYLHRIRYVYQKNRGISASRNRGISLSRGDTVAFLDSDDRWLPEKLARQVATLAAHPRVGLVCSRIWRYEIGREERREVVPTELPKRFEELLAGSTFIPTSTVLLRRHCLETVGTFDRTLPVAEDRDLWLRIARHFEIVCLEEPLAEHRRHPENTTRQMTRIYEGYWRLYSKLFALYGETPSQRRRFEQKAFFFRYLLGTTYLKQRKMPQALGHLAGSLRRPSCIVTFYLDKGKHLSFSTRLASFLKPYGAFALSLLGAMVSIVVPNWRSR